MPEQQNWISVLERLPDPDNPNDGWRVMAYDEFYGRIGEAQLASWNKKSLVFIDSDDCSITHWQPFPKPPNNGLHATGESRLFTQGD